MYSLSKTPEDQLRWYHIAYPAMSIAKEKSFANEKLLEQRVNELEDRLINHYHDKDTVRSDFRGPLSDFDAFKRRHPGESPVSLESKWHEHLRREEDLKKSKIELEKIKEEKK